MISCNELFVFWGVRIDEYGANKWRDHVLVALTSRICELFKEMFCQLFTMISQSYQSKCGTCLCVVDITNNAPESMPQQSLDFL